MLSKARSTRNKNPKDVYHLLIWASTRGYTMFVRHIVEQKFMEAVKLRNGINASSKSSGMHDLLCFHV